MNFILQPWQPLLAILSGWVRQHQQQIIEFQNAQIESLLNQVGKPRILLSDDQRRLLAVKGKALGRTTLRQLSFNLALVYFVRKRVLFRISATTGV